MIPISDQFPYLPEKFMYSDKRNLKKKSKIVKKGNIYSCVQHSIPKVRNKQRVKKKK